MNRYINILSIIIFTVIILSWGSASVYGARQSAYGITGRWASLDDYHARILTVDGVTASPCSEGVIYLGASKYQVPAGVTVFQCARTKNQTA